LAFPHYHEAMSFSETVFLFLLALIIFGPKKLPEIARQAGRLLAELRRASNEFKSQIETEIAHLEVEKSNLLKNPTVLPPEAAPQGTVSSKTLNPAPIESSPPPPEPAATLAAPTTEPALSPSTPAPDPIPQAAAVAETSDPASQASHV
jgi:sec-independent protein translocase protein TatB